MDGLHSAMASYIVDRETGELVPRGNDNERRISDLITRIRNTFSSNRASSELSLNRAPAQRLLDRTASQRAINRAQSTESLSDRAGFTVNGRVVENYFTRVGSEGLLNQPVSRIDVVPEELDGVESPNEPVQTLDHERQLAFILATHYGMTLHNFHQLLAQRHNPYFNNPPTNNDDEQFDDFINDSSYPNNTARYDDELPAYETCNEYRHLFVNTDSDDDSEQQSQANGLSGTLV